ncbi:HNH endonuclease signature motif containing protein [Virgibacillus salexigens]|uniref:HNH endonuclease signature motif containing protein n=2 Tax=Virgibacillus TaxID=84406 RepID=UPI001F2D533A|nr:HNH endonuclease signature motif containing protein [Virgibacillus massiliensis]
MHEKSAQKSTREYNQYKRDPKVNAFYKSSKWRKVRAVAIARDKGLCQRCLKQGILRHAQVVHHLVEVNVDWELRYDLNNLESVCHACHNREHNRRPPG